MHSIVYDTSHTHTHTHTITYRQRRTCLYYKHIDSFIHHACMYVCKHAYKISSHNHTDHDESIYAHNTIKMQAHLISQTNKSYTCKCMYVCVYVCMYVRIIHTDGRHTYLSTYCFIILGAIIEYVEHTWTTNSFHSTLYSFHLPACLSFLKYPCLLHSFSAVSMYFLCMRFFGLKTTLCIHTHTHTHTHTHATTAPKIKVFGTGTRVRESRARSLFGGKPWKTDMKKKKKKKKKKRWNYRPGK